MRFTEIISEDTNPKRQAAKAIAMKKAGKKPKSVAEDRENFNGINLLLQKDDEEVFVKASAGSRELGHVLFVMDGDYLMPQDLEVEERYRGQGIAQTMYDFVKSKGYKIRRSGQQTDAGAGFWAKHRPEQNVWEEGVAEGSIKDVEAKIRTHDQRKADREQAGDPYVAHEIHSHNVIRKQLLDKRKRAQAAYQKKMDQQGVAEGENWSKHNNKRAGGMSKKSVSVYRREHPGSKIQTAVTTKPSKLKKGSKAAKRRASFCARMRGMKKHRTGAKTANDPNSNINKSLRRWHCESIEELHELVMLAEQYIRNNKK